MRHLWVWFLWLGVCGQAAAADNAGLLDMSRRSAWDEPQKTVVFTGEPVVAIGPTVGAPPLPKRTGWMDEEKLRLFGTTDILAIPEAPAAPAPELPADIRPNARIEITTPFGQKTTASFSNQITDFLSIVQPINETDVLVEERIHLINANPRDSFARVLPRRITTAAGKEVSFEATLVKAALNGRPVSLNRTERADATVFAYAPILPPGVYVFTLSYLMSGAIQKTNAAARLTLPLAGNAVNRPVERFAALVLFPQKTKLYTREILFGANNVRVPATVKSYTDARGNTLYQLTRPLPAFADVRLEMTFDGALAPAPGRGLAGGLGGLSALVLILYLVISGVVLKRSRPPQNPIQETLAFPPIVWRALLSPPEKTARQKAALPAAFAHVMAEQLIGSALLILAAAAMTAAVGFPLSAPVLAALSGGACIGIVILYTAAYRPFMLNLYKLFARALVGSPAGLNPSAQAIGRLIPYAAAGGVLTAWRDALVRHNPNYRAAFDLTARKKERILNTKRSFSWVGQKRK